MDILFLFWIVLEVREFVPFLYGLGLGTTVVLSVVCGGFSQSASAHPYN